MPHARMIVAVRQLVAGALACVAGEGADSIRESILIRDGLYCGRRFETSAGYAIWFVEENQVKIFEGAGRVIDVLHLDGAMPARQTQRIAA
jgi:hypothetical protein